MSITNLSIPYSKRIIFQAIKEILGFPRGVLIEILGLTLISAIFQFCVVNVICPDGLSHLFTRGKDGKNLSNLSFP